jgi:hypothetical protein
LQTTSSSGKRSKVTKIPAFKLSYDVLRDLCKTIDRECSVIKNVNQYCNVIYKFKVKPEDTEMKTNDSTDFLSQDIIRLDLQHIVLRLYSDDKEFTVNISFHTPGSYIFVEGNDFTWVDGIASRLKDIFIHPNRRRRVNDFFNSEKVLLVCIPPSILFGILHAIYLSDSLYTKISSLICWPITYSIFLYLLFRWLYPKIETEYTVQARFRRTMVTILSAIALSVIASYLWQYLPH